MRAGLLRQRLVFQALSSADDGRGGSTPSWSTSLTAWGRLAPLEGAEAEVAGRLVAGVTHEWAARYSATAAGLTPKHRISWSGRVFQIVRVLEVDARRRQLRGLAKEIVS